METQVKEKCPYCGYELSKIADSDKYVCAACNHIVTKEELISGVKKTIVQPKAFEITNTDIAPNDSKNEARTMDSQTKKCVSDQLSKHPLDALSLFLYLPMSIAYLAITVGIVLLIIQGTDIISLSVLISGAVLWFFTKLGLMICDVVFYYCEPRKNSKE